MSQLLRSRFPLFLVMGAFRIAQEPNRCAKPLPEDLGDEILHFSPPPPSVQNSVDFWWQKFSYFPRKLWLRVCHSKNFRNFHHIFHGKEIYHLELALGGTSRNKPEPETGTVGTVFPGIEGGTGTIRTVMQEPQPETGTAPFC